MEVLHIQGDNVIMQPSNTSPLYNDETTNPKNALSRETVYNEEEFEDW